MYENYVVYLQFFLWGIKGILFKIAGGPGNPFPGPRAA